MKKEEKQQKFGFFFAALTACKKRVKQIVQNVKKKLKKPHTRKNTAVRLRISDKKVIIKIQKKEA